jgi:hypothetical protein
MGNAHVGIGLWDQRMHPRVTFQGDFSKRLEPLPGMKVVDARTILDCDRDQVKKLFIGYSR